MIREIHHRIMNGYLILFKNFSIKSFLFNSLCVNFKKLRSIPLYSRLKNIDHKIKNYIWTDINHVFQGKIRTTSWSSPTFIED